MISAVIPAHNEEARIGATVRAVSGIADEVIVVDDGSTDRTTTEAKAAAAHVIRLPQNQGKGRALTAGIEFARGDVLLLLDADLGESASEASCLLEPIAAGEADMTIATFPINPGAGGGFGIVVETARHGISSRTGREMAAPLSGQRGVRREVWNKIARLDEGFGVEVGLTIDALRAGFRVIEVPTTMTHRVTGRDVRSILHRARQLRDVKRALRRRPK